MEKVSFPMGLGWMTWIEGSLAKQIEVPQRNWNLELAYDRRGRPNPFLSRS